MHNESAQNVGIIPQEESVFSLGLLPLFRQTSFLQSRSGASSLRKIAIWASPNGNHTESIFDDTGLGTALEPLKPNWYGNLEILGAF